MFKKINKRLEWVKKHYWKPVQKRLNEVIEKLFD